MGWFDEQIRERMRRDQEVMEDSFVRLAGSVLGSQAAEKLQDERLVTKEALDEILRYYHMKPVQIPDEIRGFEDQLDYVLRPLGLMTRNVALREDWYRHAYGPMLGILRENNMPVALLPGKFFGYEYRDPATGNLVRINRSTAKLLSEEALCFYMPLPMKKLGIPDLMLYMKRCISRGDWILIILATFIVTQVGMLEPRAYQVITGPVLRSKNVSLLAGMSVFLLCAAFSNGLLSAVTSILTERISLKTSLAVEAAVMMRILSLPLSLFLR